MLRDRNDAAEADAATVALRALTFQLADDTYRSRFLQQCGIAPQDLSAAIESPDFLAGILEMILHDEPLLLAFCDDSGLKPEQIARASRTLSPQADV